MVELHFSLRCSEYFSAAATVKLQASIVTTMLVVAARMLLRLVEVH